MALSPADTEAPATPDLDQIARNQHAIREVAEILDLLTAVLGDSHLPVRGVLRQPDGQTARIDKRSFKLRIQKVRALLRGVS